MLHVDIHLVLLYFEGQFVDNRNLRLYKRCQVHPQNAFQCVLQSNRHRELICTPDNHFHVRLNFIVSWNTQAISRLVLAVLTRLSKITSHSRGANSRVIVGTVLEYSRLNKSNFYPEQKSSEEIQRIRSTNRCVCQAKRFACQEFLANSTLLCHSLVPDLLSCARRLSFSEYLT